MMRLLPISLMLLLCAGPAAAQDRAESKETKPVKEKKICKDEESTGSRMPKRVCKTAAEWQGSAEQDVARLRDFSASAPR